MLSAPVEVGLSALELARVGRFAEVRELFAPQLRPLVTCLEPAQWSAAAPPGSPAFTASAA